jgi:signal transduction histidine kinase/ActR/RegA family two-component response regulator
MSPPNLPVFNWSLIRTFERVPNYLEQTKIKVFIILLSLCVLKIFVNLPNHLKEPETGYFYLDIITLFISILLLKTLFFRPELLKSLIHISLATALSSVFLPLLLASRAYLTIPDLQIIFLVITFSYWGLGRRWGGMYTCICVIPVLIFIIIQKSQLTNYHALDPFYSKTSYLLVIALNFIAIAASHYHFYKALFNTIDEKKELNEQLQLKAESRSQFLSTMSHELRTPLNSVIGMANLLLSQKPNDDQKENLGILKFSAENLLSLINNILDFNKMESGNIEYEQIAIDLTEMLGNAAAALKIRANEKNLILEYLPDEKVSHFQVVGDPTRLVQVISNLLGNSLKFTQQGKVSLSFKLMKKEANSARIRFMIKDTGIGIPEDKQKLIFEPFTQANKNTSRYYGGTGLGLPIVKNILSNYKSRIYVESKVKEGAMFYFDITFPTVSVVKPHKTANTITEETISIDGLKVLLAEDNEISVFFMKKLFANWNLEFTIALNGEQVITKLQEHDFDVILMDLHMPLIDGVEATRLIRQMPAPKNEVFIIALTAEVSADVKLYVKECKFDDYLSKPFPFNALKEKLQKAMIMQLQKKPKL